MSKRKKQKSEARKTFIGAVLIAVVSSASMTALFNNSFGWGTNNEIAILSGLTTSLTYVFARALKWI